ncbi:hypothetical protein ACWD6P_20745 [Streptomyces sp. NPDC002446]
MSAVRRTTSVLVGGFAALLVAGAAVEPAAAAAPVRQPPARSSSAANSFLLYNVERNFSDTWDGRALFRLTSSAARTGEGSYFLCVPATETTHRIPGIGQEVPSDWRAVLFTLPDSAPRVEVRFGDIENPGAAELVAWVEELPADRGAPVEG